MTADEIKLYKYRWAILGVFFLLNAVIEIQWILLAPITGDAVKFYGVSELQIGLLSIIFMLIYIIISIPVSYIIDTWGIRIGIGIGALLTGTFGFTKGIYAENYTIMCVTQVGLAVAQPFILNACTRLASEWFPVNERATATGIGTLGQYVGIIIVMETVPRMLSGYGIPGIVQFYGFVTLAVSAAFLIIIREKPPTPPCHAGNENRMDALSGFKHILKQPGMILLLALFFIGLGMFNAITTWIEQIISTRGFSPIDAGNLASAMFIGGVIGASVLSPLSDKYRRRRPFLIACMAFTVPGIIGLTFAAWYWLLMASGFMLGFFIMSAGPIGFQYAAEISYPAPESMSQGLILMTGQLSGILFIIGMDTFRTGAGSMAPFMIVFVFLSLAALGMCIKLKESEVIKSDL